jgi:aspartyl-tRNA(Asn)/glutamyl-tRNA(Gln) amidotransferase subunit B
VSTPDGVDAVDPGQPGDALLAWADVLARFDPVLGLEVHVELSTLTKMFCGCPTEFGAAPNTHTCPTCLALPGALPVVNGVAVESAVRLGLALNCSIASWCRFARKNYFYPDMPKNYQISQYDEPIAYGGWLDVEVPTGDGPRVHRIEIERAHMEEDTGKSSHVGGDTGRIHGADYSLVDYNRAGIPLIEVVTKPIEGLGALAPDVARAFVAELRALVLSLGISDAHMHQGSLRCDVNLSLRRSPQDSFGTRSETKNVNSLRSVSKAVRYEMRRQGARLEAGGRIVQETRHWHEDTGITTSGRSKEEAEDYRYFPEPDLVPVAPDPAWVEALRVALPELPAARRHRMQSDWGVSDLEMAAVLNADALDVIEATIADGASPSAARKWWLGELARLANEREVELGHLGIFPADVARVIALVEAGTLTDTMARQVVEGVLAGEGSPDDVVAGRGLRVVGDDASLLAAIDEAVAAHPDVVVKIRSGKVTASGVIVGAVMKATRGQADAARVRELLMAQLGVQG